LIHKPKAMKKPEITFNKVAYIRSPIKILNALNGYGFAGGDNGDVCVAGINLEEFEDEDQEVQTFINQVVEEAADCDIIFHK